MIFLRVVFPSLPTFEEIVRIYEKNQSSMLYIVDAFQVMEFNTIGIDKADGDYRKIIIYDNLPVERYAYNDDGLFTAIESLFDSGMCKRIFKDNNYIFFTFGSSLRATNGVIYSIDSEIPRINEEAPPEMKEEIIKPLGVENWYYYHHKTL